MKGVTYQDYARLLAGWVVYSQQYLYRVPGGEGLYVYGQGDHGHWGVQTQQKALAAFAVAATDPSINWADHGMTRADVLAQALGMLRYNLRTHLTGDRPCTDGQPWGHNWIYTLGVERMMHGVEAIGEYLTGDDQARLLELFRSECEFLYEEYPIKAGLAKDNKPESNIWNGATLYRGAAMLPSHPQAAQWRRKANEFLINGCSFESDETSTVEYEGQRVCDAFVGANYFDSAACHHHLYLNIGYMAICLSNVAMLHFSCKAQGQEAPAALYHHVPDVWDLLRACTFPDGRLNRIGGDTRVRYCYCQDYLMPIFALVTDKYGEDVSGMEQGWYQTLLTETEYNGDGSFLGCRLNGMEEVSPVYYTRLESDRANAVSMLAYWKRRYDLTGGTKHPDVPRYWHNAFHGAQYLRGEKRLASIVWRAAQDPQILLVPKDDSSLAEWHFNMTGEVRGLGEINGCKNIKYTGAYTHADVPFEGGFLSYGQCPCRSEKYLAEGQNEEELADKMIACAALPDDATMLVIQRVTAKNRAVITGHKALFLNIPNDLFNGTRRHYRYEGGQRILRGGEKTDGRDLPVGQWMNVDHKLGAAVLPGRSMTLLRPEKRQVGMANKPTAGYLYCDELVTAYEDRKRWYDPGQEIFREAFAVQLGNAQESKALADSLTNVAGLPETVISICAQARDGECYALLFNTGDTTVEAALAGTDMACGEERSVHAVQPHAAVLIRRG